MGETRDSSSPFWSPNVLRGIKIKIGTPAMIAGPSGLNTRGPKALDLEAYLQRRGGEGMDLGTVLASIATYTWVRGSVLTRNTDHCLRQCELVPRSATFSHSDPDPTENTKRPAPADKTNDPDPTDNTARSAPADNTM